MSEPTRDQAEQAFDDGLLSVDSFLCVLRDEAERAADRLRVEIDQMRDALAASDRVYTRLFTLAHTAERAAEREVEKKEEKR